VLEQVWHTSASIIPCIFELMTLKEKTYQTCVALVQLKIDTLQKNLHDLTDSAGNETKRTAGDKHETALAMLQIEQENNSRQLKEVLQQKAVLEKLDPQLQTATIVRGSLVETNKGRFYISIGLGKLKVNDETVFAVSPEAPLGKLLLMKKAGDTFTFNDTDYKIISIT
jgi:transcription elongation GreA/GreB family factor